MISVCIATYNGGKYIHKQIESILLQLSFNDEIIISDNGSTDETIEIISAFNDVRIKIFHKEKTSKNNSINCFQNFEYALTKATGDVIFLSDQDDIWAPNKVETILPFFNSVDLIVHDCYLIDSAERVTLESYFKRRGSGKGVIKNFIANTYLGCCMAFKKDILKLAIPFPLSIPMHDVWLGIVAGCFYKVKFIPNKLTYYREHESNVSPTANGVSKFNYFQKFIFRFNSLKLLPLLIYRKIKHAC